MKQISTLEDKIISLEKSQEEFTKKALLILSLGVKNIYSTEEAAAFLDLSPDYIYQLIHQKKLRPIKGSGKKKNYFRKKHLEDYLMNKGEQDPTQPPKEWRK